VGGAADGGSPSSAGGGGGGLRVEGSGFGDPPWPPDLEGGPGAAAGPAVASEWSRRLVGQGRWRGQETGSEEVVVDGSGGGEPMGGGSGGGVAEAWRDGSAAGASDRSG
jgi:hypothetical protein